MCFHSNWLLIRKQVFCIFSGEDHQKHLTWKAATWPKLRVSSQSIIDTSVTTILKSKGSQCLWNEGRSVGNSKVKQTFRNFDQTSGEMQLLLPPTCICKQKSSFNTLFSLHDNWNHRQGALLQSERSLHCLIKVSLFHASQFWMTIIMRIVNYVVVASLALSYWPKCMHPVHRDTAA